MNKIKKVVIPTAGVGSRLLPATKEIPKEMLPIFDVDSNKRLYLKPIIQVIYEKLYDLGFREFCFVVGRRKRIIENYFSEDLNFINYLKSLGKHEYAEYFINFYKKLKNSTIVYVNQATPKGFGDAVNLAKIFTGNDPFLVHAGDDLVLSRMSFHITRLVREFNKREADAIFLVERIPNPKRFGVITGIKVSTSVYKVTDIVEKPRKPPSNLAVVAIYVFSSRIYDFLRKIRPGYGGEIQLTDAIKELIGCGGRVYAVELLPDEKRIDVGTPISYCMSLELTYRYCLNNIVS